MMWISYFCFFIHHFLKRPQLLSLREAYSSLGYIQIKYWKSCTKKKKRGGGWGVRERQNMWEPKLGLGSLPYEKEKNEKCAVTAY